MTNDPLGPGDEPTPPSPAAPAARRPPSERDDAFWAAVRDTYASGVTASRTAALFGVGESTFWRRAQAGGWQRRNLAGKADAQSPVPPDAPRAQPEASGRSAPAVGAGALDFQARADASDPVGTLMPLMLDVVEAGHKQLLAVMASGDAGEAEKASRMFHRLASSASNLVTKRRERAAERGEDAPSDGGADTLLADIEKALAGGLAARRAEVEALNDRGIDPREGWVWDQASQDWIWDPGSAMARVTGTLRARSRD